MRITDTQTRANIQVSLVSGRKPIFPIIHLDSPSLPSSILADAQFPPLDGSITQNGQHSQGQIFTHARQLLLALASPNVSQESLHVYSTFIDDMILRHLHEVYTDTSESSRRSRAIVLAVHVFVYVTVRRVSPRSTLMHEMCRHLQNAVVWVPNVRDVWEGYEAALLWVSFVGILGTGDLSPEGACFRDLFQSIIENHAKEFFLASGGLCNTLGAFLWDECLCVPLLASLESSY